MNTGDVNLKLQLFFNYYIVEFRLYNMDFRVCAPMCNLIHKIINIQRNFHIIRHIYARSRCVHCSLFVFTYLKYSLSIIY